jgi:ParB family transcriptional regulator, chromosome partitioning protein
VNVRRGGLGRGLGALIPTGPGEDAIEGARFDEIPLESIEPNPRQPREVFDPDALAELVTSIREVGVLQPVVVRELDPGRYQLIMGERRWRACREAGLETVPAIIRDTPDTALLRDALLENLHRQELNALEEAAAYAQLLDEFGATHEELADRVGRSRSHVTNTLRLLHLTPSVQRRVAAGVLSAGHARALLALESAERQEQIAARVVAEGLSVRAVEEIVAVGVVDRATPTPRAKQPLAPALAQLADRLSDRLETRVSVELGRRRGKVVIQFGSVDDLERIAGLLGVSAGPDQQEDHSPEHEHESPEHEHGYNDHGSNYEE